MTVDKGRGALDLPGWLAYPARLGAPIFRRANWPRRGGRRHRPSDILLPQGYRAEVVAASLTAPVHVSFGPDGFAYVAEAGHHTAQPPRVVRVDVRTGEKRVHVEVPKSRWTVTGALTGSAWVDDALVLTNTDSVARVTADGTVEDIVSGLPGHGDHQVNHPIVGPDGKLYFGVGSATNWGVVGPDNFTFGWLSDHPDTHDVPARDITLAGTNFEYGDVVNNPLNKIRTGAFVPYGTETIAGHVIPGDVKANGAILRCRPDGSELEVVAWGLRNPYGLAFDAAGRLFATEHGGDDRGPRQILNDPDDLYEIREGAWYGWPDFASGVRLDDPHWGEKGQGREPVLAEFPDPEPPKPVVSFEPHVAANGLAIAPGGDFGFEGQAFVALFGDLAPITTARVATPRGYKIVRVDLEARRMVDFAVNRIQGPASKLPHGGFERPSHCAFGPDGALYVVDWGEMDIAPESAGVKVQHGSGTLWRIVRTSERAGEVPPPQTEVPFYAAQYATWAGAAGVAVIGVALLVRRAIRRRRK
jgi:glucose/arabinose dehydrogenase